MEPKNSTSEVILLAVYDMPVAFSLNDKQLEDLRRKINEHYLGDPECNLVTEEGIISKYPDKETPEFLAATRSAYSTHKLNLKVGFYSDGSYSVLNDAE